MRELHTLTIYLHMLAGGIALFSFWLPVWARKGGNLHKRWGSVYASSMYAVAASALVACAIRLLSPLSLLPDEASSPTFDVAEFIQHSRVMGLFLGLLALLVFANVKHGVAAIRVRDNRAQLRTPVHLLSIFALLAIGLIGLYTGLAHHSLLLKIFSPLAILNSVTMLRYLFKSTLQKNEWWIEHLNNLLGAGIATHTAVVVVGSAKIIAQLIPANLQVLPWTLPGVVGAIAATLVARHYRKRFGHDQRKSQKDKLSPSTVLESSPQ